MQIETNRKTNLSALRHVLRQLEINTLDPEATPCTPMNEDSSCAYASTSKRMNMSLFIRTNYEDLQ